MRAWPGWLPAWAAASILGIATLSSDPASARTLCIGKESVLLRAGPSWRQDPVGSLPAGACGVQIVGKCVSGWCEVALGSRRGWVDSKLVNVHEGAPPPAKAPPKQAAPPPPPRHAAPASPPRETEPTPPPREAEPPPPPRPERDTGYLPPVDLPGRAAAPPRERDGGHCVMGVQPGDTLRIRSGPSAEDREIGRIPPDACGVTIGGPCRGAWCPVIYRGIRGWSNASYLRPPWMR